MSDSRLRHSTTREKGDVSFSRCVVGEFCANSTRCWSPTFKVIRGKSIKNKQTKKKQPCKSAAQSLKKSHREVFISNSCTFCPLFTGFCQKLKFSATWWGAALLGRLPRCLRPPPGETSARHRLPATLAVFERAVTAVEEMAWRETEEVEDTQSLTDDWTLMGPSCVWNWTPNND